MEGEVMAWQECRVNELIVKAIHGNGLAKNVGKDIIGSYSKRLSNALLSDILPADHDWFFTTDTRIKEAK